MTATARVLFSAVPSNSKEAWVRMRTRYIPRVEAMIVDVTREVCGEGSPLLDMADYLMEGGGKRLRALLPLLVADALGVDPERLLPFAAACEALHNATLVHDDIQDGDHFRRGRPAVWSRFGVARAINLGDAMMMLSVLLVQRVHAPHSARISATSRIAEAALALAHGQDFELSWCETAARPLPTREHYATVAAGKTSSLFSLTLAGAAELCDASPEMVAALQEIALDLGLLFQIQDDMLDLHEEKGRRLHSDLDEGKRSFLVVAACERLTPADASRLVDLLDIPREKKVPADIEEIAALLHRAGALDAAREEIRRLQGRVLSASPAPLADLLETILSGITESSAAAISSRAP